MPENHTSLQEKVLDQIKSGKLHMRPRSYFTLKVVLIALLSACVLGISIVLANMILFAIVASGRPLLLGFGPKGMFFFVRFFPYPLLLLDVVLIVLVQSLLRRWRFGYRTPMLYLIGALVVVSAAGAFALHRGTPVERVLAHHAQCDVLPPGVEAAVDVFGGFLKHPQRPSELGSGVYRGVVYKLGTSTLTIADNHFGTTTMRTIVLPTDSAVATTAGLDVGERVFVAGDEENGIVHAFGVHTESHEEEPEELCPGHPSHDTKNLRPEEE